MVNTVLIVGKKLLFQAAQNQKIPIFKLFIQLLTQIYNEPKLLSQANDTITKKWLKLKHF